jgi:hypothetical protein
MHKIIWVIVLVLLTLPATGWNQQADQFTPVVVSPLTTKSQAVLGTDGRYHVVYALELINARPVTASVEKIAVLDARDPSRVIAAYEGDALLSRLRTLGNTAAGNPLSVCRDSAISPTNNASARPTLLIPQQTSA